MDLRNCTKATTKHNSDMVVVKKNYAVGIVNTCIKVKQNGIIMNEIVVAIFHANETNKNDYRKKNQKKIATCYIFQDSLTNIIAKFASF